MCELERRDCQCGPRDRPSIVLDRKELAFRLGNKAYAYSEQCYLSCYYFKN